MAAKQPDNAMTAAVLAPVNDSSSFRGKLSVTRRGTLGGVDGDEPIVSSSRWAL
jgi:hypothetical protein